MEQERQHRMRGIINTAADALILGLLFLSAVLSIYTAIAVFPLNPYWIELLGDYSGGFVRRFLLGEILNNIPGVPPAAAGLTVLTACYVFVTASLYAGVRRLNLPLFLRILVLLSPSGVASYILVPNQAIFFLSRDILIIAIVILSVRAACFVRNNADRAGPVLLGDFALCALVTFGMLCHSGILFCTPPLLLMYLGSVSPLRKSLVHAAVLGMIFLGEFLTVNLAFGELSHERVLDILDMFKAQYPGIPSMISHDSLLFPLFNVTSGGESYWVGRAREQLFSLSRVLALFAAVMVPCLIFLCRFIRSRNGVRDYLHKNRLAVACSLSSFSPVLMTVFATDFLRWLAWSFVLSCYFAMQGTDRTEEQPSERRGMESGPVGFILSAAALAFAVFYTPSHSRSYWNQSLLENSNLAPLATALKMHAHRFGSKENYQYVISNENWNWEWDIDTRAAPGSTEEKVRIRDFSGAAGRDSPSALESGCAGEFMSVSLSGRRLYLRGWEALVSGGKDGRVSLVKPVHGMGFLLRHNDDLVFYPTMPLRMSLESNGKAHNIPFAFDDYLLVREAWFGSRITTYPAFLSGSGRVFYCNGPGREFVLPAEPEQSAAD